MGARRLRIYLKTSTSQYLRFLWFHEYKEKEMLLGINGLTGSVSTLDSISPDRIVTKDELRALHFDYSNTSIIHEQVDHISCHADGTFHIKTKNGKDVYRDRVKRSEPLGINTKTFMDFIIISDCAKMYTDETSNPESPNYVIPCEGNEFHVIGGKFSGASYPVESEMAGEMYPYVNNAMCFLLNGKVLKGVLFPSKKIIKDEIFEKRPPGTIVVFRFPQQDGKYLIKGFVFS